MLFSYIYENSLIFRVLRDKIHDSTGNRDRGQSAGCIGFMVVCNAVVMATGCFVAVHLLPGGCVLF